MNYLESALRRITADLDGIGRPWCLVGALAVAAHAEARATLDVDVAVAVGEPSEAEEFVSSLRKLGYRWHAAFGSSMTSLIVPDGPPAGLRLDALFALAGIEAFVARRAVRLPILEDLPLPVARRGHMVTLKLLAAREPTRDHDSRDLRVLLAGASEQDIVDAREAIQLLESRGSVASGVLARDLERFLCV